MAFAVQDSPDLRRIENLPRRVWTPDRVKVLQQELTAALRTADGTETLRPVQAVALAEVGTWKGGYFPVRVGGGKTLISALVPRMLSAFRPLLLVPANMREETETKLRALRRNWVLPPMLRVESYSILSMAAHATLLDDYQPDLIVADECHKLKDIKAACTRRVSRYLRAHPECRFVGMSGSIMVHSVKDFAHLVRWALKTGAPVPLDWMVLDEWARALDGGDEAYDPGHLQRLCSPGEGLLSGFRRRLVQTPGVVIAEEAPLAIPLKIRGHEVQAPAAMAEHYRTLRKDWATPDGWYLEDGTAIWRHARELQIGYYSRWNPRPPEDWALARKRWGQACRAVLEHSRRLDSVRQVVDAILAGNLPGETTEAYRAWKEIEPSFEPQTEAVWLTYEVVDGWIADMVRKLSPVLIWTDRIAVGETLAKRLGLRYYGAMGVDQGGRPAMNHDPRTEGSAIMSIKANGTGRNFQERGWSRNLILDVPQTGSEWEQLTGRTHRPGQAAPEVTVDLMLGCAEDIDGFWTAHTLSERAQALTGQPQKLMHAEINVPEYPSFGGPQWTRNGKRS